MSAAVDVRAATDACAAPLASTLPSVSEAALAGLHSAPREPARPRGSARSRTPSSAWRGADPLTRTRTDGRARPAPPRATQPTPLAPFAPGTRLDGAPYVIVDLLGQGGMGEVYEAEHVELGARCAIKILHRTHAGRVDLAARMRDEARALGRIRHPNLVEVFDLGELSCGRPWFAMPLLRGRDLRRELRRAGVVDVAVAARLVAGALDGLAAAHAAGLVHRDVKLENLFVGDDGSVKLLDFGVAKALHRGADEGRTFPGSSPGTPRTMAPEQILGCPIDARADVYAAGLALYELCVGRGPFDDLRSNDQAMRFAHCERAPVPPSRCAPQRIPPAIDAVILRALAKGPADRFQTAAEMAEALRAALAPEEPVTPRLPAPEPHATQRPLVASDPPAAPARAARCPCAPSIRQARRAPHRHRALAAPRCALAAALGIALFSLGIACGSLGVALGQSIASARAPAPWIR